MSYSNDVNRNVPHNKNAFNNT